MDIAKTIQTGHLGGFIFKPHDPDSVTVKNPEDFVVSKQPTGRVTFSPEVIAAKNLLQGILSDLDIAAMPTKSEVFAVSGRTARDLHDAIRTICSVIT